MRVKYLLMALTFFTLALCTGCGSITTQPGDTVIPPAASDAKNSVIAGSDSLNNSNSANIISSMNNLNNISNMNSIAQPSSNMAYSLLDNRYAPVAIYADNKYLYLLRSSGGSTKTDTADTENEHFKSLGNVIEVYDVENASLVRTISYKSLTACSAFSVKDSNIYTFDVKTGHILLFSSSGSFLSAYDTELAGVDVEKIVVAKNRFIILKIREKPGENSNLAVLNMETEAITNIEPQSLSSSQSDATPEITDFCLYGESLVLATLSTGRLCLYNIEDKATVKSCVFPITTGYIEFDGNVLYYSSDGPVTLTPGNTANFSNMAIPRVAGRMLINSEFSWPDTTDGLGSWLLGDLPIPFANDGRHYGMAQNNKYLFFVDLLPAEPEDNNNSDSGFLVYRIMK